MHGFLNQIMLYKIECDMILRQPTEEVSDLQEIIRRSRTLVPGLISRSWIELCATSRKT